MSFKRDVYDLINQFAPIRMRDLLVRLGLDVYDKRDEQRVRQVIIKYQDAYKKGTSLLNICRTPEGFVTKESHPTESGLFDMESRNKMGLATMERGYRMLGDAKANNPLGLKHHQIVFEPRFTSLINTMKGV